MTTTSTQSGLAFDAGVLFGKRRRKPLPTAAPGELVLRVPKDISPSSLCKTNIGKELVWKQDWYDTYPWANESLAPGVYVLRLPVPNSSGKTFAEQEALLLKDEEPAPLVLLQLAMLCLQQAKKPDPLNGHWVRCRETTADGRRVELAWGNGRLRVAHSLWDGYRRDGVWLAAVRGTS